MLKKALLIFDSLEQKPLNDVQELPVSRIKVSRLIAEMAEPIMLITSRILLWNYEIILAYEEEVRKVLLGQFSEGNFTVKTSLTSKKEAANAWCFCSKVVVLAKRKSVNPKALASEKRNKPKDIAYLTIR